MAVIKNMLKSWFTSLFGVVAGIPQIVEGLTSVPRNWTLVVTGLGMLLMGLTAKDGDIKE